MIVFRDRCYIVRPFYIDDPYSSIPVFGGYEPDEHPTACAVSPLGSSETVGARSTVETRYRLLVGPRTDLGAVERVQWRGIEYSVEGDVERHTVAGVDHHLEVIIRRQTG